MAGASKFAGGDQAYLRDVQYAAADRLAIRANLHTKYRTSAQPWPDWVHDRMAVRSGERVLECGCGPGWLWSDSTRAMPTGVHVTLTDLSPGMVDAALARARSDGRITADSRVADLQSLPFDDASFDLVVANHMMYHLPDPARGVAELARVVRPRGRVVVSTNGRQHTREMWAVRASVFGTPVTDQTVDVFGAETGFALLRERFLNVSWHQHTDSLRCTDPADVLAYICSTPPGEDATPEQIDQLRTLIDERFAAEDGIMTITKDSGCFVCRDPR